MTLGLDLRPISNALCTKSPTSKRSRFCVTEPFSCTPTNSKELGELISGFTSLWRVKGLRAWQTGRHKSHTRWPPASPSAGPRSAESDRGREKALQSVKMHTVTDAAGRTSPFDFWKGVREAEEAGRLVALLLTSSIQHCLFCGKSRAFLPLFSFTPKHISLPQLLTP